MKNVLTIIKRVLFIGLIIIAIILFAYIGFIYFTTRGYVYKLEVKSWKKSAVYSDEEINSAIEVTKDYFVENFGGCYLTEIKYGGDEMIAPFQSYATDNNADEVIVLISSFDVGKFGGDGSLSQGSTYSNWNWILIREKDGDWRHCDHGY